MIELLIGILLSISVGTACDLGVEVDWYRWAKEEGDTAQIIMTVEPVDRPDAWVYREEDGDLLLFVFMEDIQQTLDSGRSDPHGECARLIETTK